MQKSGLSAPMHMGLLLIPSSSFPKKRSQLPVGRQARSVPPHKKHAKKNIKTVETNQC